jgi:signal peptidase II
MDDTQAVRDGVPGRRSRRLATGVLLIAVLVVVVDQAAKAWAVAALADGRTIDVVDGIFQLHLYRNPGAAFSFATGMTWLFTIVAIVVSVVIVRISRRLASAWWALALGLLLGGAMGNLLDRLFREPGFARGHVVDFFDLPDLFIFNVADACITTAAVLIGLLGLRGVPVTGAPAPADPSGAADPSGTASTAGDLPAELDGPRA